LWPLTDKTREISNVTSAEGIVTPKTIDALAKLIDAGIR
jgi:hypothetical protein